MDTAASWASARTEALPIWTSIPGRAHFTTPIASSANTDNAIHNPQPTTTGEPFADIGPIPATIFQQHQPAKLPVRFCSVEPYRRLNGEEQANTSSVPGATAAALYARLR